MRVSEDYWEPPPQKRNPSHVLLGPERIDAINTEKCPKCGADPMYRCVYVQVPLPKRAQSDRYLKSGTPTKVPHIERVEALRFRRRRERRRKERKALEEARAAMVPRAELLEAAHAMRQFDFAEHARLRARILAYGDILVNAGEVLQACS